MKIGFNILGLFLMVALASVVHAQQYPSRTITFVVPAAAGGTNDIIARTVAARMFKSTGQAMVVDNKVGASGAIAAAFVAKAAPDGYTLLTAPSNLMIINKWVYKNLQYDSEKDFAPVTLAGILSNMLIVHPSVPAKNVQELIAYARANPKKLNFASFGHGSTAHLSGELFKLMAGVDMVHVAYNGSAPALKDLLGGHVQLMFDNMPTALPLAKDGKVRGLAVTGKVRSAAVPAVPTIDESGLKGFDVTPWFSFVAPAQTPKPIIAALNAEITGILKSAEVSAILTRLGLNIVANTPEEFSAFIAAESDRFRRLVERAGVKPE